MRGTISFEQELRATRLASGQKKGTRSEPAPDSRQDERPWQADVEQLQQTMRDVVRAIASFSGVEIPGLPADVQDDSAAAPKLKISTLKDRLRNDLEGFSLKTTAELAKRAREQTRAALEEIQNEIGGRVEQAAAELREELQLPAQVDKLLRPCVAESEARLQKSVSQKFEELVADQQRLTQDGLQRALGSIQTQVSTLEQSVQQLRELKADSCVPISGEQQNAVLADAMKQYESRFSDELGKVERLLSEQQQSIQERLQSALDSIQAQMSALGRSLQQVRELKADSVVQTSAELNSKIDQHLAEQQQSIQEKIQSALGAFQAQMSTVIAAEFSNQLQAPAQVQKLLEPCVGQAMARLESSFVPQVELLLNEQDQWLQEKLQGVLNSVQTQVSSLDQKVQQIQEVKADLVAKLSTEQPDAKFESLLAEQDRSFQGRLQSALGAIQAQMSTLEQSVYQIRKMKVEVAAQASAEQQNAVLDDAIKQYEGRLSNEFEKVLRLLAEKERLIQVRVQAALSSVQAQMSALERKTEQFRELNAGSVAQVSPERPNAVVDSAMKQAEISLNNGIKEFLDRSFSRIEGSFNNLMETPKFKAVQSTHAKLESLRKALPNGSTDMLVRVQQALDNLDRLGSKDPLPAS